MKTRDLARFVDILSCPICRVGRLSHTAGKMVCSACSREYGVVDGVPILLPDESSVNVVPAEHESHPVSSYLRAWLATFDDYTLNLGAGTTDVDLPRHVELERQIFRSTDVVGDAHQLPFADESFAAILTLNTFEHLRDPAAAAAEVRRVLKPGGQLFLRTAFVQPLHEEPHNYYNVTEYGLRRWFGEFGIEKCSVSEDMSPVLALGWLSSEVLWQVAQNLGWNVSERLASTTLNEWRQLWACSRESRSGFIWDTIRRLPDDVQKRFAMGLDLYAVKPQAAEAELTSAETAPSQV